MKNDRNEPLSEITSMDSAIKIARAAFITACGLLNFIYTTIASMVVFENVFEKSGIFKNRLTDPVSILSPVPVRDGVIRASIGGDLLIPLYFILGIIGLLSAVMFIYYLIEIPKLIALFYKKRLGGFLFIDSKRTIRFFIMIALPLVNLSLLRLLSPNQLRGELIESMILCTITHPGILILLIFIRSFKDRAADPGVKFRFLKIIAANSVRISILVVAVAYIIPPYLLYYHYETGLIWVGIFHFFLISAVYSNYRFYRENFIEMIAEMESEEQPETALPE
jgi:hypothetical protein